MKLIGRTYLNQQIKELLEKRFDFYLHVWDEEIQKGADEIEELILSMEKH